MEDVKIRTGRDCVAWYRDRWLVAYLAGAELRLRDWTTGQEQMMARRVGSYALAATEVGAMLIYVRAGTLFCRRLMDVWLPEEAVVDSVAALPSLCCWSEEGGLCAEVVFGGGGGGVYARRYEGGQWERALRLDDGTALAEAPSVCVADDGSVFAAWRERDDDALGATHVRIATKRAWWEDWEPWDASIEDASDPFIAHDGVTLWVGVHHDWTVRVHPLDEVDEQVRLGEKLAASALFPVLRGGAGQVVAAWSWWAGTGDSHRDDLRGVACALGDDEGWAEQPCTKDVGQCQPGLARGKTSWALAWADTVAGQIRLQEIPMDPSGGTGR